MLCVVLVLCVRCDCTVYYIPLSIKFDERRESKYKLENRRKVESKKLENIYTMYKSMMSNYSSDRLGRLTTLPERVVVAGDEVDSAGVVVEVSTGG